MSIIDKANEYVGHPFKMDESYTTSVRRDAYAQGYQDAIDKACEWLMKYFVLDHEGMSPSGYGVFEYMFRKAMKE